MTWCTENVSVIHLFHFLSFYDPLFFLGMTYIHYFSFVFFSDRFMMIMTICG